MTELEQLAALASGRALVADYTEADLIAELEHVVGADPEAASEALSVFRRRRHAMGHELGRARAARLALVDLDDLVQVLTGGTDASAARARLAERVGVSAGNAAPGRDPGGRRDRCGVRDSPASPACAHGPEITDRVPGIPQDGPGSLEADPKPGGAA